MSDTSNPLSSFFFANADNGLPQSTRQKMALAMMLQKRTFPKTFGEGLASIGDSIGDAITMRQMSREAAEIEKTNRAVEDKILGSGGGVAASSPQSSIAGGMPQEQPLTPSIAAAPPSMQSSITPPMQPAVPAVPLPPDQQQSYAPDAPVRLSSPERLQDFRNQNPLPRGLPPVPGAVPAPQAAAMPPPVLPPTALPPDRPAQDFNDRFSPAGTGRRSAMPAPPASSRDAIAATLASQQAAPPPVAPPSPAAFAQPPAPVPSQVIKKAPAYEPDYVPPERPATSPPPTMTPRMQQIQDAIRNATPGEKENLAARLKAPYDNEVAQLKLAHEAYQSKLIEDRTYETKREELKASAAKRGADYAHTVQQTNAGKIIQMEGRAFRVMDDGSLKDITPGQTGDGPPQIKMTQDQSDTLKFYKMGKTAAAQLEGKEDILAKGWADELAGKVPFAGNKLMGSQYRAAKNAAGLLVQADLRDTSGATIGTQEFADRFALLIPKSGDDPLAMRNKAEARKAVLEGQRLALGTARPMADYVDKEHAKERAERTTKLDTEMSGKDKSKVYEKNGVHRKFNGSFWEEY